MIELILFALALVLYMLGAVVTKEYVDLLEELENDFLPRPGPYWWFIATWPYRAFQAIMLKEVDSE